jgi:aminopeptidase N
MKGAFFFRAVAKEIGPETLDEVLAAFYQERRGTAAGMQDLLDAIQAQTGFDPTALANHWLR